MKYFKVLHIPRAKFIVNPTSRYDSVYFTEDCILSLKYGDYALIEPNDSIFLIPVKYDKNKYNTFEIKSEHLEVLSVEHRFDDVTRFIKNESTRNTGSHLSDISSEFTDDDLNRLEKIYQLFKFRLKLEGVVSE